MPRLTLKQVQEYAQQYDCTVEKNTRSTNSDCRYVVRRIDNPNIRRYAPNLQWVKDVIKQGFMLTGDYCAWQPQPSHEPWDDAPTEPNPKEEEEDTESSNKSLSVSFAPPIKVVSVSPEQNTAQVCIGELIKTVHLDEQGTSEEPQVIVTLNRGNTTLTSKVKLTVAYYSELMVPPDEVGYSAFPLAVHGGWVRWIDPPRAYTVREFNIAFNNR